MERVRFSGSGDYAAVSGSDGRLRIWDSATSRLKQEFIPSSHLSATCTCLEWAPTQVQQGKQKKRKKVISGEIVVMGTAVGSLLFYEVTKAELVSQQKEAHLGKVSGLSWSATSLALYSCGEDGYIVEWDPENTKLLSRWKGSKSGLSSVRVFQNKLLAASQVITLWDLETKTSITSFSGHPNQVAQVEIVPESDYFISMGQSERHLKIWSASEKNPVATISVPEIPQHFNLSASEGGQISVSVITVKGQLHLYQHKLNGRIKKPMSPTSSLRITDSHNETKTIPILVSCLHHEAEDPSIITAYGSWLNLRFEKFELSALSSAETISREFFGSKKKKSKSSIQEDLVVEVPSDVKHLQPGTEGTLVGTEKSGKKRKKELSAEKLEKDELPMEERLSNLTMDAPTAGGSTIRGNNLAHLLSQGLHSKDSRILNSVLSRWDEEVITNTIRSLPVQLIVPLLKEVKLMLAGKGQLNNSILKWLKSILKIHSSYLMSCPSSEDLLGPFMSLLRTREVLYPQMCQLRGKLELIKGNIEAKQYRAEPANEALLDFHDDSAEEEDDEDAMILSESEELLSDDLGVEDSSSGSQSDGTADEDEDGDTNEVNMKNGDDSAEDDADD